MPDRTGGPAAGMPDHRPNGGPNATLAGDEYPFVSVLVAARNEAATLPACLDALARLSYPANRYEVLIGDDASDDGTAAVAERYVQQDSRFRLFTITTSVGDLNGKANVLAQLANVAQGEFLFITDADVRVPETWLATLLRAFSEKTGVVSGCTTITGLSRPGATWFARWQALDWTLAVAILHQFSRRNVALTALGNNMAVRRSAYNAVGGFAALPYAETEDFALLHAIRRSGWGFAQLFTPDALAETLPAPSLRSWLAQRKRWMRGAFQLPPGWVASALVQYATLPLIGGLAVLAPNRSAGAIALALYAGRYVAQTSFLAVALRQLRQPVRWRDLLTFTPAQDVLNALALLYYVLPRPLRWKGRVLR